MKRAPGIFPVHPMGEFNIYGNQWSVSVGSDVTASHSTKLANYASRVAGYVAD